MSRQEIIGYFAFLIICITPLFLLSLLLFRRLQGKKMGGFSEFLILLLVLCEVSCFIYGWAWEPTWLEFSDTALSTGKFPQNGALNIVHLSDLHFEGTPGDESRIEQAIYGINLQKPDVILITGDYLISPNGLSLLESFITQLAEISPVYGILGNWDLVHFPKLIGEIEKTGIHLIDGKIHNLVIRGMGINLIGIPLSQPNKVKELISRSSEESFQIVLHHNPDLFEETADLGGDLYLCGHTHGGQIRLPWYGAIVTLTGTGKEYEAGLYRRKGCWCYTNRGLGLEGGGAPRVRFWCRPEVNNIIIRGTN